jgi:hypothetical protein
VYHLPDECLLFGKLFRIIPLFCRGAVGLKNKQRETIKVKLCHLITAYARTMLFMPDGK